MSDPRIYAPRVEEEAMSVSQSDRGSVSREFAGLPMPADQDLVFDRARRPRVTRGSGRRFPFPIPNGWFIVARGDELDVGDVMPLFYFGRDLVLYRTAGGEPRLLDAHCPHLGANLAVGGRVEGEVIRCPFHGWCLDGETGACVEIPYSESDHLPNRATTRTYPTLERNHMIWAWHHREEKPPFYDVPVVAEFHDADWAPIISREYQVASCCQEMAENNVDYAHFKYVHGTDAIPEEEFVVDGTYKRSVGMNGNFVREGFGLGLGVLRVSGYCTFLSSTTPIDEENLHVRWIFTAPKSAGEHVSQQAAESFCTGVSQDIPIWENKIYRERPVLTKSERSILEHRKWSEQFYSYLPDDSVN
ncbi:MAG TPA: Rieske 2Fe-2S domain-containing protein [Acidimicrobiales bacterium]|jgi:phenylpropionate dioxygenase-like ring-hydroxylating dioxygenase large terminal subunit